MKHGHFLSLDGLDGAGKSTHCRLLADWLAARGWSVTVCRDPGGTPLGDRLRSILLESRDPMSLAAEMFLYMASRAQLTQQVIRPALDQGHVVLADRYLLANVVYQGHAGGLPVPSLWDIGRLATGGLEPEVTLVLDLPVEVAFARKQAPADRMEGRGAAFFASVRAGFLAEAERAPHAIKVIDATPSLATVQAQLRQEAAHVVGAGPRS